MANQYRVEITIETGHDISEARLTITATDEKQAYVVGYKAAEQLGFKMSQIVGLVVDEKIKKLISDTKDMEY